MAQCYSTTTTNTTGNHHHHHHRMTFHPNPHRPCYHPPSWITMMMLMMIAASVVEASSMHESMNLFRCDRGSDRCLLGVGSVMHYYSSTAAGETTCMETCVYFTGQVSRTMYHCGKCPSDGSSGSANTSSSSSTIEVTYQPGNLTGEEAGLILSAGLTARILATKNQPVQYADGTTSTVPFHQYCDAGATFVDPRPENQGGWIYVSNSEYRFKFDNQANLGGVGALTFDKDGQVIQYQKILSSTTANCAGGKTPWNTWVSCEEYDSYGTCYEVDPTGGYYISPDPTSLKNKNIRYNPNSQVTTGGYNLSMTSVFRGMYESFAYDVVNTTRPHFYATTDDLAGVVRRFTPNMTPYLTNTNQDQEMWNEQNFINTPNNPYYHTLLMQSLDSYDASSNGNALEFLVVVPAGTRGTHASHGTFEWTTDFTVGAANAQMYHPNVEGIDVVGPYMYFICKVYYTMFILNLNTMTYRNVTTQMGLFDGQPDQVDVLLNNQHGDTQYPDAITADTILLYFTEDTNRTAGIHGRTIMGDYVPILQSTYYVDETVGMAFSPNYRYMYMGYQNSGIVFEISRTDKLPFYGTTLNVKYHNGVDNPPGA
jgi:Bacterial protein of unknown function (DUF839)